MPPRYRARKLRLVAPDESELRRATHLIDGALRTASLGDSETRVFLVRHFVIGTLSTRDSEERIATALAARFVGLQAAAVHGAAAGAARAEAVWFHVDEAPIVLARELALGAAPDAWFWPLIIPGYSAGSSRQRALGLALRAAVASRAGLVSVAALVERAGTVAAGSLFALLSRADGEDLLTTIDPDGAALREAAHADAPMDGAAELRRTLLTAPLGAIVERWIRQWGASDPRALWLTAMALLAAAPSRSSELRHLLGCSRILASELVQGATSRRGVDPTEPRVDESDGSERGALEPLPEVAHSRKTLGGSMPADAPVAVPSETAGRSPLAEAGPELRRGVETGDAGSIPALVDAAMEFARSIASDPNAVRGDGHGADAEQQPNVERISLVAEQPSAPARSTLNAEQSPPSLDSTRPSSSEQSESLPLASVSTWQDGARATQAGGILFLVWVLGALGIEQLLQQYPALAVQGFGARVLLAVAQRLKVPEGDAMSDVLRSLLPAEPATEVELGLIASWLTASRRYCRVQVGRGLVSIVCRRGRVSGAPTHVDVVLPLQSVDIRVRTAGLDIDPGWVPWLGRVVSFHYVAGGANAR